MRKIFLLLLILFLWTPVFAESAQYEQPTAVLINTADSNDAALDVNQTNWGDVVSNGWPEISSKAYTLKVKFYVYDSNASGPNDVTFSYQFYLADYGCNAEIVASGTATCGAAQLSHNPIPAGGAFTQLNSGDPNTSYCWVDTFGVPTQDWASGQFGTQNDGGGDSVAALIINRECAKRMWCRIYNRSRSTMTVYCIVYYY